MRISFAIVVSSLLSAASASSSLRSVAITEDTPPPGTSASSYALCTEDVVTPFGDAILVASNECAATTSYDWNSVLLPTTAERTELCTCTQLINKLKTVKVPHCAIYRSGALYSYAQLIQYAFGLCNSSGGTSSTSSSTTTTTATSTPTTSTPFTYTPITYTPFTYTPIATKSYDFDTSTSSSTRKSKSKVGLIVGVLAGVVGVGGLAGFVVHKRKQSAETDDCEPAAGKTEDQDQLSPLGETTAPFAASAPTPSPKIAKQLA